MVISIYRIASDFVNMVDSISLVPPPSDLVSDEIKVVLPQGYTLGDTVRGPVLYDEHGKPCELCLNGVHGSVILAVSATRAKALKTASDRAVTIPLVTARIAAGLTQRQLADASGVNIRQIQKVEGGEAKAGNLTARNLLAIARALQVSPESLIEE